MTQAEGKPDETTQNRALRWGVVGTGTIARRVMSDLLRLPDAELVAVASRSAERGQAFAADLLVPEGGQRPTLAVFEQVADMLPEIDVLYVATPHPFHAAAALPALESGTAVLVEKAITSRYADAVELVAASRTHGSFLMEAVWTRFTVLSTRARELIADGVLGDVMRIVADFSFQFPPADVEHRLWNPALGGGALFDMGPYPVSLIQSLLGEPTELSVVGSLAGTGVDESVTLLMGYPNGAAGVATCSLRLDGPSSALVQGTSGAQITLGPPLYNSERMTLHRPGRAPVEFLAETEGSGYLPQLREVQRGVRAGDIQSPVMPHDDTLAILRVLTTAHARLGAVSA
ncbi:Gfo/Idh/MocA family protein [Angustibacter sp. McL0619]|uniref:Gfo/Idh/MocA family protein n=1 Tax=Angustibacter sp. McL0619 TaxID=3415676 RepID=UPI003CE8AB03